MTTIRLGVLHPTGTAADERSTGSVEWVPSARRVVGADVILPDAFRVALLADADVTVAVAPTTTAWVWKVLERVRGGSGGWRYLAVPDSAEVVDYAALVEVDSATLDPIAEPTAAWWVALDAKAADDDPRLSDPRTPTAHSQAASTISDSTAVGRAVLTAADAAAARGAIGAGTSSLALGTTAGTALDASTFRQNRIAVPVASYRTPPAAAISASAIYTDGNFYGLPMTLEQAETYDRITAEVTTAGQAGSVIRLGIYNVDPTTGVPTTLVLDAGTIPGNVVAVGALTIALTLPPGTYCVGAAIQNAATTKPTVRAVTPMIGTAGTMGTYAVGGSGWRSTAAGALPASFVQNGTATTAMLVYLRRSA